MLETIIDTFKNNKDKSKDFREVKYLKNESFYKRSANIVGSATYLYFEPLFRAYQILRKK